MEVVFNRAPASCRLGRKRFSHLKVEELFAAIPWQQNSIRVFGKTHLEPRLTAWYGPPYAYSSVSWPGAPLPALLQDLCDALSQEHQFPFNSVLLNCYRNGLDAMGWHRDNEPEMDTRLIASVSLGASRSFKIRDRESKETWTVDLDHGSLLVMENMQENYEHSLPRRKKADCMRINLTFRRIRT